MLYALVAAPLVLGFVCPPVDDGAPLAQLGQPCGGTCDALGKCADGLTCEKPVASPLSFAILTTAKQTEGVCQKVAGTRLGENPATWAPEPVKKHLLGEDSATYAPRPRLGEDSATWAPEPRFGDKPATWAPEPVKKHMLGEDPATYAPRPRLGEDSATYAPRPRLGEDSATYAPRPRLGEDSATWAPEPVKKHMLGEDPATYTPERRQLLGGAHELPPAELQSAEVEDAAKFALARHLMRTQYLVPVTFVRVVSATKQVVRGVKYTLTFELSDGSRHTAVVVHAGWLKPPYELLELDGEDMTASNGRRLAGALAGGVSETSVDSAEVRDAAKFGFMRVASMMNSLTPPTFVRVVKASTQVVAGVKYDLEIELSDGQHHRVVVWDQPWVTPRYSLVTHEVLARGN